MWFIYKTARATIQGFRGLLAGVFVGIVVDRAVKFIDAHQFFDLAGSQIGIAVKWLDWVISQPWFWPAFSALASFVAGTYLDAFVRRYAGAQPAVKKWLEPLDAVEAFTDGELRSARDNARERQEQLKLEYDTQRQNLARLIKPAPFGSSGGIIVPEQTSPELEVIRARLSDIRTALTTSGEPILKAEKAILDDIISQLKSERLIARAFRVKYSKVAESQMQIPAEHWLLLEFSNYDPTRQSVEGGGKVYKGLQIGWNKNYR